jgi:precorrin isomerase
MNENSIQQTSKNLMNRDTKIIGETIQQCNLIFHKKITYFMQKPRTTESKRKNKNTQTEQCYQTSSHKHKRSHIQDREKN